MGVISFAENKQTASKSTQAYAAVALNLPVAPLVVARTRFSPPPPQHRDCMMVPEAMELLHRTIKDQNRNVSVVAVSGPGDPLVTPDITLYIIRLIRQHYPGLKIGLKTRGIGSQKLAAKLADAGLDFVEMQVDAVTTEILEKLYAWIRPGQRTIRIKEGAELLLREQRSGLPALKFHELSVSISTTLYPGYNLDHVAKISAEMMELGADSISLIRCRSEPGVEVELETLTNETIAALRMAAEPFLRVIDPRIVEASRALGRDPSVALMENMPKASGGKVNVAVVSSNGIEVDLHLGQATQFLIYGPRDDGLTCLLEARDAPLVDPGKNRWEGIADLLADCFVLLVASAGEKPRSVLASKGLKIVITEENIEGTVDCLYAGHKKCKK
ncbi:MAG: dinitrogenase iron-molybdenum cofactor biosynthesis protein [Desulfotalea sp.]|nr:MAG: dinitrogenase iron-molybdenum cofactor biosynthesis protein [Desulfotalea sp.]